MKQHFYNAVFYNSWWNDFKFYKEVIKSKLISEISLKSKLVNTVNDISIPDAIDNITKTYKKDLTLSERFTTQIALLKLDLADVEKKTLTDYLPSEKRYDRPVDLVDYLFLQSFLDAYHFPHPITVHDFVFSNEDTSLLIRDRNIPEKPIYVKDRNWGEYLFFYSIEKCIDFFKTNAKEKPLNRYEKDFIQLLEKMDTGHKMVRDNNYDTIKVELRRENTITVDDGVITLDQIPRAWNLK